MALFGAHISIAGGLYKAWERANDLGCEAMQIFPQSSRTWAIPEIVEEEVELFQAERKKFPTVRSVVAHNSYLLNLSTNEEATRKKSVAYFIRTMERCEAFGLDCLITHPGSHLGSGEESGVRKTSESLNEVLKATKGFRTQVTLENTAGQGGCVGHSFRQLKGILDGTSDPDRISFCFDTQHAFAAGYDLRTREAYEATFSEWEKLIGTKKIIAFLLNDALKEFATRVDRHQNIGMGFLGKDPFQFLGQDSRFEKIPMCLETDPGEDCQNYRREIKLLKSLSTRNSSRKSSTRGIN